MSRTPIVTYEYVPPHGDPALPIKIHGLKEYNPNDNSAVICAYWLAIPEGIKDGLPTSWEAEDWGRVLSNLHHWFPDETSEGMSVHMKCTYRSAAHFPRRRWAGAGPTG